VEGYTTKRCHMGDDYYFAVTSPSQASRTRLFFKGREVYEPNLPYPSRR